MNTQAHARLLTAARNLVAFLDWREGDPLCTQMAEDATERGLSSEQYRADLVEAARAAIASIDAARVMPRGDVFVRLAIGGEAVDDGLGTVCVLDRGDGFEVFVEGGLLPDGTESQDFGSGPDSLARAFDFALAVAREVMVDQASPDGERF